MDPDDPRPPYLQVSAQLRAAILTKRLGPGEKLPSGAELSVRYGVSRQTIQQALRPLRDEGLIVGRQGSGTYVRSRTERPVELRPHVERAFEVPEVTIDFAGFTGETLSGVMHEPLDKIRSGFLSPMSIRIRVLVPNPERPWAVPCRAADLGDSPAFRKRMAKIADRSLGTLAHSVAELARLGLVRATSLEVRAHGAAPLFKMYILNGDEVFFGLYPIEEHAVNIDDEVERMWDLSGADTVLFHQASDGAAGSGGLYVEQFQRWFDSVWDSIATELIL